MEIDVRKEEQTVVISLTGRMDAVSAPQFDTTADDLLAQGDRRFIINFETLEYISSAGLRSILAIAKVLKTKEGKLVFAGLQGPVKDVFKISGFGSIFTIFDNEEEALSQL